MMLKRINMSAIGAIALSLAAGCVAATWGQNAMAAEGTSKADDMSGIDHSKMDQSADGGMSMDGMQGGSAPANARDPHAYSGGYVFRESPRLVMADEYYMSGLMANRLERAQNSKSMFNAYDMQGFVGKDYDRLVVKAEGEVAEGKIHEARTELLWGHAVAAYWNSQLGMRNDSGELPGRNWLALGVQGLAPYWFEVDATAYVGEQGRTAIRLGAEYELLITQKLILQPRIEANFYGMQDEARELGTGLSSLVAGMRLRYEIKREFAPYVGVDWNGKFGGTADYARTAGARTSDTSVVAGLRLWF